MQKSLSPRRWWVRSRPGPQDAPPDTRPSAPRRRSECGLAPVAVIGAVVVGAIMATGAIVGLTANGGRSPSAGPGRQFSAPASTSTTSALPPIPAFEAADAAQPLVPLFTSPNVAAGRSLANPTSEHIPLVFLVRQDQGDWLDVQIPTRPNGATAWVRRADVTVRAVVNHIVVHLGEHRLTVLQGEATLGEFRVAIGASSGPTPTGDFYVDAVVRLRPDTGVYGAGQLSVTAFSGVYQTFGGGVGEIAIHGTNDPSLIGQSVSHGCLRMVNSDWLQLASFTQTGTPVQILP